MRVALIGCGGFARQQHAPILRKTRAADLVACCDLDLELARRAAADDPGIQVTSRVKTVLADPSIDAVVIAVGDAMQADLGIAALEAGKHVYLEKPGGTCLKDLKRLAFAADKTDLRLVVGFNKRFAPAYQEIQDILKTHGPPQNLSLSMVDDAWRWSKASHGGSLWVHDGGHLVDLACWMLRKQPFRVYATEGRSGREYQAILSFPGGSEAVLRINGMATMDFPKERAELVMNPGVIQMDDYVELRAYGLPGVPDRKTFPGLAQCMEAKKWVALLADRGLEGIMDVRKHLHRQFEETGSISIPPNFIRDQGWQYSLESFFKSITREGDSRHVTLAGAAQIMSLVEAVQESMETGKAVDINPARHGPFHTPAG